MSKPEASENDVLDDCGLRDLAEHLRGLSETDSRPDQFYRGSERLSRRDAKHLAQLNQARHWHETVKSLIQEAEQCQRCLCKKVRRDEKCEALLRTVMSPLESAEAEFDARIEKDAQRLLDNWQAGDESKAQRLSLELETDLQDAIVVSAKQEQRLLEAAEHLETGPGDTEATSATVSA